jgi:UDP-N-acetylmuramoyl-L-alanyl-D-glutamate--2,6-diaminopimelate ligase
MLALAELVQGYAQAPAATVRVDGLVEDSRQVVPGNGYVALQGAANDGHAFAPNAVANGAVVVLAERAIHDLPVPVCVVPGLMQQRSALAARAYGDASARLNSVAVTGTNGKTSVAHYLAQLTQMLGERCGYMGTLGWGELPNLAAVKLTTSDACSVQERLASIAQAGCQRVAMEVSSHALVQQRVAAVQFDSALFTNLSRDHLDYHGSMEDYAAAKRSLFDFACLQRIVTNVDDACGRTIGEERAQGPARIWTYGSNTASVSWRDIEVRTDGFVGRWHTAWGDASLHVPLLGRFAIANVAAAMTLLLAEGWPLAALAQGCGRLTTVPGRMEYFSNAQGAAVVVDFAHTPDALQQAASSLREHCHGELRIVFGCGGDRDRGKRAQMGQAAAANADRLWITDDNPRSEDPAQIVADILTGIPQAADRVQVCHEREQAIAAALVGTQAGDVVLVAGKGHEAYQDRDGHRTTYSDQDCVRRLLMQAQEMI